MNKKFQVILVLAFVLLAVSSCKNKAPSQENSEDPKKGIGIQQLQAQTQIEAEEQARLEKLRIAREIDRERWRRLKQVDQEHYAMRKAASEEYKIEMRALGNQYLTDEQYHNKAAVLHGKHSVIALSMKQEWNSRKTQINEQAMKRTAQTKKNMERTSGTGFFITDNGYIITAYHVVQDASKIQVLTKNGLMDAQLVKSMSTEDIAVLKAEGNNFSHLPIISSRGVKLGGEVFTIGFPNTGLQGFNPKFTKGSISSLTGIQDSPKHFQISVPIQSGNSGGALVDNRGNVVGIIVSKLSEEVTYKLTGNLPENVNYAVKSSFVLSMLEASPGINSQMKQPYKKKTDSSNIVEQTKKAVVLILAY